MTTDEKILEEADFYIENDISMKEVGEHFGVSKKTIQVHLNDRLSIISEEKYKLVQEIKQERLIAGTKKGGHNGKPYSLNVSGDKKVNSSRKGIYSIDDSTLLKLADYIIEDNLSLRDIESITKIPKSTISDNLTKERLGEEIYSKISNVLGEHKDTKCKY